MNLSLLEIPFCFRNHYLLIKDIRALDSLLTCIDKTISEIEYGDFGKDLSEKTKLDVIKSKIINDIEKADALIEQIEIKDKSGLYPEQAKYYRPILIDEFNCYLDIIYTDE
jgi:hypothetical protein